MLQSNIIVFILFFTIISCKNDKIGIFVIKENNKYLLENLDVTKQTYIQKSIENPDLKGLNANEIENIVSKIINTKNYNGYLKCFSLLNLLKIKYNISINRNKITDCETDYLKNDLFLYFITILKINNLRAESDNSTHCIFGNPFANRYKFDKDSIIIETISRHNNNFTLVTDSIIDYEKGTLLNNIKYEHKNIISKVSIPKKSIKNKFIYNGKIFYQLPYSKTEFIQRINDTITLP